MQEQNERSQDQVQLVESFERGPIFAGGIVAQSLLTPIHKEVPWTKAKLHIDTQNCGHKGLASHMRTA